MGDRVLPAARVDQFAARGHGDRVAVGPSAFVARTGGEEFVALDLMTLQTAAGIAENIRAAIEATETPKATASIGVATGAIDSIAAFEAIHAHADETMYAAKRNGGNRIALAGAVDRAYGVEGKGEIPFSSTVFDEDSEFGAKPLGR